MSEDLKELFKQQNILQKKIQELQTKEREKWKSTLWFKEGDWVSILDSDGNRKYAAKVQTINENSIEVQILGSDHSTYQRLDKLGLILHQDQLKEEIDAVSQYEQTMLNDIRQKWNALYRRWSPKSVKEGYPDSGMKMIKDAD